MSCAVCGNTGHNPRTCPNVSRTTLSSAADTLRVSLTKPMSRLMLISLVTLCSWLYARGDHARGKWTTI